MRYFFIIPVNIFVWAFCALATIVLFFLASLLRLLLPFDRKQVVLQTLYIFWARMYLFINPLWSLKIEGKSRLPRNRPLVMVSNHQSMIDILVIQQLFVYFKWVSKVENFKVPFLGWVMSLNKNIPVDRSKAKSYLEMVRRGKEMLALGNSVMIFPEGTRTPNGKIFKFREGAFKIALEAKVGILPMVIDGTRTSIPKNEYLMKKRVKIRLIILDEIPFETFKEETPEMLAAQVQKVIEERYYRLDPLL